VTVTERRIAPSKDETALLAPFAGLAIEHIAVPQTQAQFDAAADEILAAGAAGFDTEARPTFAVGQASDGPHTVQFALADRAFIFQPQQPGSRAALARLLESDALVKVGFGLQSDRSQIQAKLGLTMRAVLDLDTVFRTLGYPKAIGVRAAVGVTLGQRFHKSKKTTTSNWAQPRLSERQLLYAANDAFAALRVWQALRLAGVTPP
jgi:ribonuclease D